MVDYHLWPHFERFPVADQIASVHILPAAQFPKLTAWVATMLELPAVKATRFDPKTHVGFITPYLKGETVNYEYGLAPGA